LPEANVEEQKLRQEYDFSNKNPSEILTDDELEHFEEGMRLKNYSRPAEDMDFGRAADIVASELNFLLP
jgi:hypothetical protein